MSTTLYVPRYAPPSRIPCGADGIPDYVSAVKGERGEWRPGVEKQLEVRCNGTPMRYVLRADRKRGWVVTMKVISTPDGDTPIPSKSLFYQGRVTFRVRSCA